MGILDGKKAIITGGGSGIGYAIAETFLEEGAEILISGRKFEKLVAAKEKLSAKGKVHILEWDISDVDGISEKIQDAADILKDIDILVNNAGVLTERDFKWHYLDLTPEEWDYVMNINCKGTYFMCQNMIKYFLRQDKTRPARHILNVASEMGVRPACVTYGISKWGVVGMTQGLGMKLAPKGIVINGIAPGATATEMMGWHEGDSFEREMHPNKRLGYPKEMGKLVAFLCSEYGDNIVGEVVTCDGGSHLY
jgi:3-oxoacyl-[acyl-carrier protein] reductase